MGVHDKDVYDEIRELLQIPEDEPIFILRAQDDCSPGTLSDYLANAKDNGTSEDFQKEIVDVIMDFAAWRHQNESSCKTPD